MCFQHVVLINTESTHSSKWVQLHGSTSQLSLNFLISYYYGLIEQQEILLKNNFIIFVNASRQFEGNMTNLIAPDISKVQWQFSWQMDGNSVDSSMSSRDDIKKQCVCLKVKGEQVWDESGSKHSVRNKGKGDNKTDRRWLLVALSSRCVDVTKPRSSSSCCHRCHYFLISEKSVSPSVCLLLFYRLWMNNSPVHSCLMCPTSLLILNLSCWLSHLAVSTCCKFMAYVAPHLEK